MYPYISWQLIFRFPLLFLHLWRSLDVSHTLWITFQLSIYSAWRAGGVYQWIHLSAKGNNVS